MISNREIASKLRTVAALLEEQQANPFRVTAYRHAAATVDALTEPLAEKVLRDGFSALTELPGIGAGIARSISEFIATGRMSRLDSLQAGHDPIVLFEQIPGIGTILAHRIVETLHIDSLQALELAAHNGRLKEVPGFSAKKIDLAQTWLAHVLGPRRLFMDPGQLMPEPPVSLLLQIDAVYREKAAEGKLPVIAPKRFNPTGEAWLPVMHRSQQGWHFTALFSNTARAHQLHRTHDWVVIYFHDDAHHEGQHTVVTETHGTLIGKRVVRGREAEYREYYTEQNEQAR